MCRPKRPAGASQGRWSSRGISHRLPPSKEQANLASLGPPRPISLTRHAREDSNRRMTQESGAVWSPATASRWVNGWTDKRLLRSGERIEHDERAASSLPRCRYIDLGPEKLGQIASSVHRPIRPNDGSSDVAGQPVKILPPTPPALRSTGVSMPSTTSRL